MLDALGQRQRQPGPAEPAAARPAVPRLPRVAAAGRAARAVGLPRRRPAERTVRRHAELGPDPDGGDPVRQPDARVEPALRAEHAGRRAVAGDEDRLLRSRRRGSPAGRIVRPPAARTSAWAVTASAGACSRRGGTSARRAGGRSRRRARASAFVASTYQNGATTAELALGRRGHDADRQRSGAARSCWRWTAARSSRTRTSPTTGCSWRSRAASGRWRRSVQLSGVAYFRASRIATLNGDQADWLACQDPAQAGFVCTADEAGVETPVRRRRRQPGPVRRRRTRTTPPRTRRARGRRATASPAQVAVDAPVAGRENHLFVGAAANEGRAQLHVAERAGAPDAARPRHGVEPASSTPIRASPSTASAATSGCTRPTRSRCGRDLFLTAAARFNVSTQSLEDQLGGALGGDHTFHRLNPALGISYQPLPGRRRLRRLQRVDARADAAGADLRQRDRSLPAAQRLHLRSAAGAGRRAHVRGRRARTLEAAARRRWTTSSRRSGPRTPTTSCSSARARSRTAATSPNVGDTRRQGVEASLLGRRRFAGGGGSARLEWAIHYTLPRRALPDPVHGAVGVAPGRRRRNDRGSGGRAHPERAGAHRQGGRHLVRAAPASRPAST